MAKNRSQYSLEILLGAKKTSSFQSGINGAKSGLQGMSSTAKKVAGLIATAFGAIKIKDFVKESVDTFSDYEQSLANTAAIANATQTEQEQLNEAAREAGKATTKTAKESADALGYMALAGWNVKESTSALQPVLKLSAASNMDLATCSDLVTDSMSALKLQVKDLPEYLDMVTKAQNSSNMNSQQMMEAYIKAGGAARTLGVSAKDTGVALGILANNGTKGAEGGTALNAMLTRLGSNKNALSMMGALGISIFDAQGKFVGLEEALKRINAGVSKLSTEDQAKALKEIAGTNYYSKMAYLLDGVKEGANGAKSAWDDLDKKLKNSDGSLEDMYNKQTNTLSATREIMNSALDDLKISFADSFDGELADGIKKLTEFINETSENISDFADTHQVEIHNAFEAFYDDVESIGNIVGNVGSYIIENFDDVTMAVEELGLAFGTYKVTNGILGFVKGLNPEMSLLETLPGQMGLITSAVIAGSAAMVGIGVYANKTKQKLAEANLEQHFGSISLSLDTLDEIAQQIVGKKKLTQVSEMLESIGKTDDSISEMTKNFKSVNEISWKVKAGFKIDKDDVDKYKSSVEEYVKSAKEAVESKGYTVSIATRLLLGNNSKVGKENNEFYAGLDSKLNSLQKKLNKKLNDAVKNGIDVDTDSAVQKLLGQIDDITSAVTNAENEAQLQTINLKYSGKDLTAQDFKQLTKDVKDYEKKAMSGYQEAYTTSMTNLNARRNTGDLSQKQYASEKKKIESAYYKQQQNTLASGSKYIMNSIQDTYPQVKGVMKRLQMNLKRGFKEAAEQGLSANELEATMNEVVDNALSSADLGKDSDAIISLFKNGLGDIWTQMDDLQEQMKQKGVKTTNSFANGMTDIEALSAITGSSQDAMALLGKDINENDEWATIVNACKQNGANIPEEIANGIDENSTTVNDAATRLMDKLKNSFTNKGINTVISLDMVTEPVNNGSKVTYNTPIGPTQQKKSSSGGNSKKTTVKGKKNAKGGIYKNPVISMLAEKDNEAVIPLNSSPRSKALYQRTGELLGMSFTDDNTSYKQRRDVRLYNAVKRSPSMGGEKINITYSPTIQVNGNADEKTLTKVVKMSQAEFAKMMQKYMQSNKRVKFS
jgi:TP901 family phage tail tape measure protein